MEINDIEMLVLQFEHRTLPKSEWTHEAHLIVAFWYSWHFDDAMAFEKMKSNIITYNRSVGTENTDNSGYHETITIFWLRWIRDFLNKHSFENIEDACEQFLNSESASKDILLKYYSKKVLFSKKARLEWVESDLYP
jgi:hypothetical protein